MPDFDLLIRGDERDFAIAEGKIVALAAGSAREEIDATGLLVLPGAIDAHVHFNEPGRADWEGLATGSAACAVGGTTTFFDMPLNSTPPLIDAASFAAKRALAEHKSWVDFGFWGGLIPGNVDELEALRDCGVVGLKAFMSESGIAEFPKADAATLRRGMERAAKLGLLVAVHAELEPPIPPESGPGIRDYLASRPIAMELDAIRLAVASAGETGCALHIVHVSSAAGVALVAEARAAGHDVTCETCPHYLVFNEEDVERLGALAKCAPPIRPEPDRAALLAAVRAGGVQTFGSDHSPAPPSMKTDPDFRKVWGGISGCQHLLAHLLELQLPPNLVSENVADRFGLSARKGRLEIGHDADLVLIDPALATEITAETLQYRHRQSPYIGQTLRARVVRTILRGRTIFQAGQLQGSPAGQMVRPEGGVAKLAKR